MRPWPRNVSISIADEMESLSFSEMLEMFSLSSANVFEDITVQTLEAVGVRNGIAYWSPLMKELWTVEALLVTDD